MNNRENENYGTIGNMIQHYNDYIYRWQKHYHWYLWRNAQIFTPTSDTFGYNERSEVVFSRGDAEDAEYSYDEIGNLVAFFYKDIEANKWKQFTPRTATFPHNVKKGPDAKLLKVNRIK